MGSQNLQPETTEERLIYWTILMTWVLWLGGLLSLVGAALGYILLMLHGSRVLGLLEDQTRVRPVPMAVLAWVAGMVAMAVALLVAHVDFELGLFQTTKSFLGWMKGWALLAVYPLAGAMMNIRPEIVTRATGKLAAQTLLLTPIFLLAEMTNAAPTLYVSPLHYLLGTGQEFFEVSLYVMDETTGRARFRFFAPWATAAAFVAGLGLILAFHERSKRWFVFGIAATTIVCILSGSRLSVVALPAILLAVLLMSQLSRPATWLMPAASALAKPDISITLPKSAPSMKTGK